MIICCSISAVEVLYSLEHVSLGHTIIITEYIHGVPSRYGPDAYIDIRMRSIHTDLSAGALAVKANHKGTLESRAPQMRAHPYDLVLGVRLNIETGRFPAVSALAARCNTQLIYTDTSLHPHKHLFAARKNTHTKKKHFIFLWFYVKRHFRPPLKLKGR